MARAIPGSAEILAIYGHRPKTQMEFAKRAERPHPLATLETVIQSPLTSLAVMGISRAMDESNYRDRVTAEEDRVKTANKGRDDRMGAIRSERQELESRLGAIPPSAIEAAVNMGQSGFTSPAPPGVEYLPNAGPAPVHLGQIGTEMRPHTFTNPPYEDFQQQVPIGGIGQKDYSRDGWGDYTNAQIQQMISEQKRLEEAEAGMAPSAEARFIPKTKEEFIYAIQNEEDPARRLELIQLARRAVDMQPANVMEAMAGTAGRESQAAVHKGMRESDAAAAAAAAAKAKAALAERGMKVDEGEATSKQLKRTAEVGKINAQKDKLDAEAEKLAKDIEKIARRAKANSAMGRANAEFYRLVGAYGEPGATLAEKIQLAYADGGSDGKPGFQDRLKAKVGDKANRVYVKMLDKHTHLSKLGGKGSEGKDSTLKTQQSIRKEQRAAMEDLAKASSMVDALESIGSDADQTELAKARANKAGAEKRVGETGVDLTLIRNPGAYDENLQPTRKKKKGAVDVPGHGRVPFTAGG